MDIVIEDVAVARESRSEIEDVLHRIAVEDERCEWRSLPDEICVKRRLSGGRSGCEVLEVIVRREQQRSAMVVKLGPADELNGEFGAWYEHLRGACGFFAPIRAATHGVLDSSRAVAGEREVVVYDHAARFKGVPGSPADTFEAVARQAIVAGGERINKATRLLRRLFEGIGNDLYDKFSVSEAPTSIASAWHRRLGTHAVIVVDRFEADHARLAMGPVSASDLAAAQVYPSGLVRAASGVESGIEPDELVHLRRLEAAWWCDRLMGEDGPSGLRVEILAAEGTDLRAIAHEVTEGSEFAVCGRLVSLRTALHRDRLLEGLPDLNIEEGAIRGPGAEVPDPFAFLPELLEGRREHRITSLVHGDLNPRNILVVGDSSCLIDYAFTGPGEAILSDFARLEGSLARDTLPEDLTWSQHVRLQRLLAAACRLGDDGAERFAERLSDDRPELASAFRLLWAVRRAARESYPPDYRGQWSSDYLEQLFLFAHLSLKWEDGQTAATLRATAAMAGVATEAVSGEDVYRWWNLENLRGDGVEIIGLLRQHPEQALSDMLGLARSLNRRSLKPDDPLETEYESLRSEFVQYGFRAEAHATLNRLREDHEVYISLQAYIDLKGQVSAGRKRV